MLSVFPKLVAVVAVTLLMWTSGVIAVEPQRILKQTANLRPEVLELALEAYNQAEAGGHVRRPILTIIDYELPSYQQRSPTKRELSSRVWVCLLPPRPTRESTGIRSSSTVSKRVSTTTPASVSSSFTVPTTCRRAGRMII